jgi:hypothetical protein
MTDNNNNVPSAPVTTTFSLPVRLSTPSNVTRTLNTSSLVLELSAVLFLSKIMKVSPSVHADLIGLAKYGDSLSDVVARLIDFYKKNHKQDQK